MQFAFHNPAFSVFLILLPISMVNESRGGMHQDTENKLPTIRHWAALRIILTAASWQKKPFGETELLTRSYVMPLLTGTQVSQRPGVALLENNEARVFAVQILRVRRW